MKVFKNILFWAATVFLVIAIVAVAVPKLFGVQFRAVLTGSMEPDIPVGSLVVIVPTESDKINVGDDISFVTEGGKVVTHRVISIDRDKNTFTTFGIANGFENKDPANRYENIIGVVRYHIPIIGVPFSWISTTAGKIITVTAIVAIYLISALLSVIFGKPKGKKEGDSFEQPIPADGAVIVANEEKPNITQTSALETQATKKSKPAKQPKVKKEKPKKINAEATDDFWNGDD